MIIDTFFECLLVQCLVRHDTKRPRPSYDRRTPPETSLSPTRDLPSCARTTGSWTVERRATQNVCLFIDVTPSKENVRQRRSRSNRTFKPDYATPQVFLVDADVPISHHRARSPCQDARASVGQRSLERLLST